MLEAIVDPVETVSLDEVVARLAASRTYRPAFRGAYGEPVSARGIGRALAAFLRTMRSAETPFGFLAGDSAALDRQARDGYRLFIGKARCAGLSRRPPAHRWVSTAPASRRGPGATRQVAPGTPTPGLREIDRTMRSRGVLTSCSYRSYNTA